MIRCNRWPLICLLPLTLAGCLDDIEGTVSSLSLEHDYIVPPDDAVSAEQQLPLGAVQVVYVNFDGVTVRQCPDQRYCSDARANRSSIISSFFGRESIAWTPYDDAAGRRVVLSELEAALAPYNVQLTTARPADGLYSMLVIAGNSELPGLGVAPLNCGNRSATDIAFVYRAHEFDPLVIANAAVHELGHAFGLSHVENNRDYMFFQARNLEQSFTRSRYDAEHAPHRCTSGEEQDAPQYLLNVLGPRPYEGYFADTDGSIHAEAIDAIYEAGITAGCNEGVRPKYCPRREVTRGQMAAFLSRALELPPAQGGHFDDTAGAFYEDDADRLAEAGITSGCAERRYCGQDPVTRAQMAVFLSRALDLPPASQRYFDDIRGAWFEDEANRLAEAGITNGCSARRYCPSQTVTRAQMASFLARALGLI